MPFMQKLIFLAQIAGRTSYHDIGDVIRATSTNRDNVIYMKVFSKFHVTVIALGSLVGKLFLNIGISIVALCASFTCSTATHSNTATLITSLSFCPVLPPLSKNFRMIYPKLTVFLKGIFTIFSIPILMPLTVLLFMFTCIFSVSCTCLCSYFRLLHTTFTDFIGTRFTKESQSILTQRTLLKILGRLHNIAGMAQNFFWRLFYRSVLFSLCIVNFLFHTGTRLTVAFKSARDVLISLKVFRGKVKEQKAVRTSSLRYNIHDKVTPCPASGYRKYRRGNIMFLYLNYTIN